MGVTTALALGSAGVKAAAGAMGSKAQTTAAKRARDFERGVHEESQAELTPWREAGTKALGEYENLLFAGPGEITEDPGYQFEFGEGVKAMNRQAASRGTLGSGRRQGADKSRRRNLFVMGRVSPPPVTIVF